MSQATTGSDSPVIGSERPSTVDEVRLLVHELLQAHPGTLRLCDALVKVATELAENVAGPASTAAWLERAATDVRLRHRGRIAG